MATDQRRGWAIDTREPAGRFLGVGWFGWPDCRDYAHLDAYKIAVFSTRKAANDHMLIHGVRESYRRARVVPVVVSVSHRS